MKPFLKWAGGKRQLHSFILPIIKSNLSIKNRYYEPFVGAGSVFLELQHPNAVINDSNKDLMLCYETIKSDSSNLIDKLNIHKLSHNKEYFYEIRSQDRDEEEFEKLTKLDRAARLIYLNKTCFNGLYRVNKNGQFNVPFGQYKNPKIFDINNISDISMYLNRNNISIRNLDFEVAVKDAKKGDFIYFDPPYDFEAKGFSDYQKEGFGHFDLVRLRKVSDQLINKGCHVLISNHKTQRVLDLFSTNNYELIDITYKITNINVKRYIGSRVQSRNLAQEVLIHGYKEIRRISTSE